MRVKSPGYVPRLLNLGIVYAKLGARLETTPP